MGKDLDVVYLQGVYNERDKWKSKVIEKIKEEKEGIKRDLENYKKTEDESWKKAIHQNINIRNEKIKFAEELLQ